MIGKRIASIRKERGWTQKDLAKATMLSRGYITAIEGGIQYPKVRTVAIIAAALRVEVTELLGGSEGK